MKPDAHFVRVGTTTFELRFDACIDPELHEWVLRCAHDLKTASITGIEEVWICYHSVGVRSSLNEVESLNGILRKWLQTWLEGRNLKSLVHTTNNEYRIPVRFGGEHGLDLTKVARYAQISESEVVRRFCEIRYRVYMTGFIGGFPYLGTVPEELRRPRHSSPRAKVPAGSVGIAGYQAGIYPVETPGGWNLIGRTVTPISELGFQPGDTIHFFEVADD